jgi:hypothetical protein
MLGFFSQLKTCFLHVFPWGLKTSRKIPYPILGYLFAFRENQSSLNSFDKESQLLFYSTANNIIINIL